MATLTNKQRDALQNVRAHGTPFSHAGKGSGKGAARTRMIGRLLDAGLIRQPGVGVYELTAEGRAALASSPSPRTKPTLAPIGSDAFRKGAERLLADIKGPRHARR